MEEYIAFDSHKRYTWVEHQQANTGKTRQYRLEHAPGAIRQALAGCSPGTPVSHRSHGQLVLDYRRDRASAVRAAAGTSSQSEADDGPDQQDRQVGYARAEHLAAQRHVAHGVDSARAAAGTARVDAHARGPSSAANTLGRIASPLRWRNGACQRASTAIRMGNARAKNCRSAWSSCRSRRAGPHSRC